MESCSTLPLTKPARWWCRIHETDISNGLLTESQKAQRSFVVHSFSSDFPFCFCFYFLAYFSRVFFYTRMSTVACNYTILQQDCTLATCCLNQATVNYIPTLAGNITYTAIFGLLLAAQLGLCLRYRTWTFTIGMVFGLTCEILGYAGRIWMHYNIFNMNPFLV